MAAGVGGQLPDPAPAGAPCAERDVSVTHGLRQAELATVDELTRPSRCARPRPPTRGLAGNPGQGPRHARPCGGTMVEQGIDMTQLRAHEGEPQSGEPQPGGLRWPRPASSPPGWTRAGYPQTWLAAGSASRRCGRGPWATCRWVARARRLPARSRLPGRRHPGRRADPADQAGRARRLLQGPGHVRDPLAGRDGGRFHRTRPPRRLAQRLVYLSRTTGLYRKGSLLFGLYEGRRALAAARCWSKARWTRPVGERGRA